MKYKILVDDRKTVVKRLEALAGEKADYTRVPRCAYIIRGITVEKNNTVITDEDADKDLVSQLLVSELIEPMAEQETEEIDQEAPKPDDPIRPSFSFPMSQHRTESVCNLVFTIYSRGKLLSKATGGDFKVSEDLVDTLHSGTIQTIEDALEAIRNAGPDALHGMTFDAEKVTIDGFPATTDLTAVHAWQALSTAINKAAIKQLHVRAKEVNDENEKYAFRTWMTRLDMNGMELKQYRNLLYRNLSGHVAFRTEEDAARWKANQDAKRKELQERKVKAAAEAAQEPEEETVQEEAEE